jgi:hypothetical protein
MQAAVIIALMCGLWDLQGIIFGTSIFFQTVREMSQLPVVFVLRLFAG